MTWQGHPRTTTPQHRKWARAILRRDPTCRCQGCNLHNGPCGKPSEQADHITPVAFGGPPLHLDNGQGLCRPCHARKSSAEGVAARKPRRRPTEPHPGTRVGGYPR